MPFRYNPLERELKKMYRKISPVQRSQWTAGSLQDAGVEHIGEVRLVPPEKLVSFFSECVQRLRATRGSDLGDYLEFGVFNGNSIGSMHTAREELGVSSMRLFGFDAFQGLPEKAEHEDDGVWKKGFYSCSFEQMKECLIARGINPDDMTWVPGWYDETLTPETAQKYHIKDPGIVFIDCDTYSSSKAVLDFIQPLITKPVILCFDDWKLNDLDVKGMGEYQAFNEFLEANPQFKATPIKSYNRKSKSFLVQPHF